MNNELTNQIIRHVYKNLGVYLPGNKRKDRSITKEQFLLNKKISFEDGEKKNIWGVSFSVEDNLKFNVLIADLSDGSLPEYAMICCLTDAPTYGTYLSYQEYLSEEDSFSVDRPMIACNLKDKPWAECNVYMQAAFLCGMEKLKESSYIYSKVDDESIADDLIKFIDFYQNKMEIEGNEG